MMSKSNRYSNTLALKSIGSLRPPFLSVSLRYLGAIMEVKLFRPISFSRLVGGIVRMTLWDTCIIWFLLIKRPINWCSFSVIIGSSVHTDSKTIKMSRAFAVLLYLSRSNPKYTLKIAMQAIAIGTDEC